MIEEKDMKKLLGMTAALALMVGAFSLPAMAGHHEMNPCNPCAMKQMKGHNPCNPCSMKHERMNPCNPCDMKHEKKHNPCDMKEHGKMNPCNPCSGKW